MSRATFSKGTPLPPSFTTGSSPKWFHRQNHSSLDQSEVTKAQHLRHIVSKIYRRKQISEAHDDDHDTRDRSVYQELLKDTKGLGDFSRDSPSLICPQRFPSSSELTLRCQANSYYEVMEQQIRLLEDARRISVEKSLKERMSDVQKHRKKVWDESLQQLEERLSQVHLMIEPTNAFDNNDLDYQRENKAVNDMYDRKEQESEARIRSIIDSAMADAAQKKELEQKAAQESKEQQRKAVLFVDFVKHLEELSKCPLLNNPEAMEIFTENGLDVPSLTSVENLESLELSFLEDNVPKLKSTLVAIEKWQESLRAKEHQKLLQKRQEEEEKQRIEEARVQEAELREKQKLQEQEANEVQRDPTTTTPMPALPTCSVSQPNLERYETVLSFKKKFEESLEGLLHDPSLKSFVFKCQKAIFTPVNSIGRANASHLSDKLDKLKSVLRGDPVTVSDKETFSASGHPLGISLCKSLLAKQLLIQGEKVVQAQLKDAFTISLVIVALWDEFEDLGTLFLANMYEASPFLVPYHFERSRYLDDKIYYKKLGYVYRDDIIEDQVTYESRMSGISRLYAAIMVSSLPKDLIKSGRDHPHGLGNAWRWLASVLNLTPINGVTSVIMANMLEVCGHRLVHNYKGQFMSLLAVIDGEFINYLKPVSMDRSIFALKTILEEAFKTRSIKQPEGLLPLGFL